MQIESPGTEYNSPRTGYPSTIINPGDSPDILATKERFISTLPDNEGRRTRETREKRGRGRKREREGQVGPRNMRAENRAPTGSDGNNGQSWPRFPSSGKRANELSNVIEPEGSGRCWMSVAPAMHLRSAFPYRAFRSRTCPRLPLTATKIGNYVGRDRFDIENWKRFK